MMHLNNNNNLSEWWSIYLLARHGEDIDACIKGAMSVFAAILSYGGWEKDEVLRMAEGGLVSVEEGFWHGVAEEACITSMVGMMEWVFGSKDRMMFIILTNDCCKRIWNPEDGSLGRELQRPDSDEEWVLVRVDGSGFVALTYLNLISARWSLFHLMFWLWRMNHVISDKQDPAVVVVGVTQDLILYYLRSEGK